MGSVTAELGGGADWPVNHIPAPADVPVAGDWVCLTVPADGATAYGKPVTMPADTVGKLCGPWPFAGRPEGTLLVAVRGETTVIHLPVAAAEIEPIADVDLFDLVGPGEGVVL